MKIVHCIKSLLQHIRIKSILARIMLTVFSGIALITVVSFAAFYRYEYDAAHTANFDLMQSTTESLSSFTSLILSNTLAQKLYDLSHDSTIREIIYYTQPLDTQTNAVLMDLNTISSNNIYISSIIFCDLRHNVVLDSKYKVDTVNGVYRDLIGYYNDMPEKMVSIEYNHEICDFFYYDGSYYLASQFAGQGQQSYGNIILQVNLHSLYMTAFQQSSPRFRFYVFDKDGEPVFSKDIDYIAMDLTDAELRELLYREEPYVGYEDFTYFHCTDAATKWKFVSQIETNSLKPTFRSILKLFTPILILVSVVAFLLSLFIIYVIYAPLQQMYNSVFRLLPGDVDHHQNDLRYITYAFSEVNATVKRMEDLMDNISGDILDHIFTDLLNNVPPKYEYVKTSIQSIHTPFAFDGIYVAAAIQFPEGYDMGLDLDEDSALQRITSTLSAYNARTGSHSFVKRMAGPLIAVITSFDPATDIDAAHKVLDNMEVLLTGLLNQEGHAVSYARGHFYHSILDITASYNRALSVLARSMRTPPEISDVPSEPQPAASEQQTSGVNYKKRDALQYQIARIINSIESKNTAEASPILQGILADLKEHKPFDASELQSLRAFLKSFAEILETTSLIKETEIMSVNSLLAKSRAAEGEQASALCTEIEEFCNRLLDDACEQYKVTQNPYLLKAKKYIEEHYSDSSLSLDIIAAECDITPNYLSKLFANSGIYYSEYMSQYRTIKSLALLRETNMSINEIAERCGFNSPQSYIRVFKKQMGVTPGNFRK